jgi:hypothetical protein
LRSAGEIYFRKNRRDNDSLLRFVTDIPSKAKLHRIIVLPVLLACRVLMLTRMIAIGIKGLANLRNF